MLMKMFAKRLRGYRAIGYACDDAPFAIQGTKGEVVDEYDEKVLGNHDDDS